jgi:Trk-type K+ transport system membrane component
MIFFVTIIFAFFTGLAYVVLFYLTKFIQAFRIENFKFNKKHKLTLLIVSLAIAAPKTYFFVFTSPATNYKTAYIAKEKEHFVLTVKGRRLGMVHDPISLLLQNTYEDSVNYIIPRNQGVIKGEELLTDSGYYKSIGTITIQNNQADIRLSIDNTDDKKLELDNWSGKYNLVWRDR